MPGHRQSAVDLAMDVVGLHLLWVAQALKTLLGKQSIEHTVCSAENKIKDEVMSLEQGCKMRGRVLIQEKQGCESRRSASLLS